MDLTKLEEYLQSAKAQLQTMETLAALADWHQQHLAKSGQLTTYKKAIGKVDSAHRKAYGQAVNQVATVLQQTFHQKTEALKTAILAKRLAEEQIDVTLPARVHRSGGYHPLTLMLRELVDVFGEMGFTVFESPHVELDEMSFQLLNIPKHHPARDMTDTFYVSEEVVMRPHTSPGQIRAMRELGPGPIQVILPGMCYRNEDINPRSEIQFHQVEGLLVGEHVRFSDLKGIVLKFARRMFGEQQAIRVRGSYFPFTEPSVEVDIKCTLCAGAGCRICKHSGWLELLGAGLVHPVVLENGGYDASKVQGIAFGLGVARLVLLRHQIEDIRLFFQNDSRFLSQFN